MVLRLQKDGHWFIVNELLLEAIQIQFMKLRTSRGDELVHAQGAYAALDDLNNTFVELKQHADALVKAELDAQEGK